MKYIDFLKSPESDTLINELINVLFEGDGNNNSNDFEYINYGHYLIIQSNQLRIEIFKSGYVELYGSKAGVNMYRMFNFFTFKNIEFETTLNSTNY